MAKDARIRDARPLGFDTLNPAGARLIDRRVLDMVFVLMLVTATLGPILTEHYAPLMLKSAERRNRQDERELERSVA